MAVTEFTIDLGNGLYLDSRGALKSSPAAGKSQFKLPTSLPIPAAELQKTFSAFQTIIPNLNDAGFFDAGVFAKFQHLALSDDFIALLGKAAKIAEKLASIVPVINIAVGLGNLLGLFGGSDPVKDLITQKFNRLFAYLDQDERDRQNNYIGYCTSVFDAALSLVNDYKAELANLGFTPDAEIARKLQECEEKLSHYDETLFEAAAGHVWHLPFNSDDYKWNWGRMTLYKLPTGGGEQYAGFPKEPKTFDHRPMVPLLVYGVQTYLTLIKAISPEYRTTGQFQDQLRRLANHLAGRLDQMRNETLARTVYRAGDPISSGPGPLGFGQVPVPIAVGALDLRADTDVYLTSPEAQQSAASHGEPGRRADLNRTWSPPPSVPFADPSNDGDILTAAAADLANRQAERDYAELLTRCGFFSLAHLESLLRHVATEPDRSETVTGSADIWRAPLTGKDATVVDDKIPFSALIRASATRVPQQCEADIFLTTQPLRHAETIGYRIRLITLPDGTLELPFDWYVWTEYFPDGTAPPNWKLQINENPGLPLDQIDPTTGKSAGLLKESPKNSAGPDPPIHEQGTVVLTADTFDWYIPLPPFPKRNPTWPRGAVSAGFDPPGAGGADPNAPGSPKPDPAGPSAILRASEIVRRGAMSGASSFAGWEGESQTPKGEKREWQRAQVVLTYDLYWTAEDHAGPSRLSLCLKSRPQDRNFLVYVVVEEYLKHSKQWLRTPVQVRFNGQLTYVPQSFFDAEAEARKNADKILGYIERNYVRYKQPQPGDPVIGWLRPGSQEDPAAMQRFAKLAEQHVPDLVLEAIEKAGKE